MQELNPVSSETVLHSSQHASTNSVSMVCWLHRHQVDLGRVGAVVLDGGDADGVAVEGGDHTGRRIRRLDVVLVRRGDPEPGRQLLQDLATGCAGAAIDPRRLAR